MILELKRILRSANYEYTIAESENIVGSAKFPVRAKLTIEADIQLLGSLMHLSVPLMTRSSDNVGRFNIDDRTGCIATDIAGKGLLGRYRLWNVFYGNFQFRSYEIGFGNKGIYLVLKSGEQTLAIISKTMKTINFLSGYTVYIEDDAFSCLAITMALYWDIFRYLQSNEAAIRHVEYHRLDTIQKELKSKFDPTFIHKIAEMEKRR